MRTKTEQAFLVALVTKFGEGAIVTLTEMEEVVFAATEGKVTCVPSGIRCNPAYKVSRGQYIVTGSEYPSVVRDAFIERTLEVKAKNEAKRLPKEVRQSPSKLLALVAPEVRMESPYDDMCAWENEEENVEDLLRVISF